MQRVQHYVIKFVSDLRQVGGFLRGHPVSSTNKTDRHDITEPVLLKVALNTIKQINNSISALLLSRDPIPAHVAEGHVVIHLFYTSNELVWKCERPD